MGVELDLDNYLPKDETYKITGDVFNGIVDQFKVMTKTIDNHTAERDKDELAELRLRDKHPSLKAAWDQYQTVRALVEK